METSALLGYIFGAILTLVNGLILFNLKKLSSEIEETKTEIKNSNRRIEILEQRKSDCQRDFVPPRHGFEARHTPAKNSTSSTSRSRRYWAF